MGSDAKANITVSINIDRHLHAAMQQFFATDHAFDGYDDLISTFLEAATCRAGGKAGQKSLLDLLVFMAWQREEDFESTLFGRPGNEHDRRHLYGLMLGMNRLDLVNAYEHAEFKNKGSTAFARDVATRFARDLDRTDAERLIETMTLGSPTLLEEMLHWLDVAYAERGQA